MCGAGRGHRLNEDKYENDTYVYGTTIVVAERSG